MTRLRGRCLRGQRLRSGAPFGHWMTQTFVAGLRCDKLTAPFVINAPMDRRVFETYVEKELAPTLEKGDVVTRARPPRRPSGPGAHGSCSCQPTAPISTPLKWPSKPQSPPPRQGRQDHRCPLAGDRAHLRSLRACRMPRLLHRCRIWIKLSIRRSSLAPPRHLEMHAVARGP